MSLRRRPDAASLSNRCVAPLLLAIALGLAPITDITSAAAAEPQITTVRPDTRIIEVDGSPLTVKGYNYIPTPIGQEFPPIPWASQPATCENDARLMEAAGVTVVRIWADAEPVVPETRACLDSLHAHGIGVAWTLAITGKPSADPAWLEANWRTIEAHVEAFRSHPATLLWLVGNEVERLDSAAPSYKRLWFGQAGGETGLLNVLLELVKRSDPNHLVGTSGAGCFPWMADANVPALDVWALNVYPGPKLTPACGGDLWSYLNQADPRPKLLSEFGTDRFRCVPSEQMEGEPLDVEACASGGNAAALGSGEDQRAQSAWLASLWDDLEPHLADAANPSGAVAGGTVFMYSDPWGKCGLCSGAVHDVAGAVGPIAAPDGVENVEWWGVTHAQLFGQLERRVTSLAFDALAARWAERPPPVITEGPRVLAASPCTLVTVSWETSEPATSELQGASAGEAPAAGEPVVAQDTAFRQLAHDRSFVKRHSVTVSLGPGEVDLIDGRYELVPRSFAVGGRSVTSPPITVRC